MSLPTIVLLPGACHGASCFDVLLPYLHALGFPTKALTLPSLNPSTPETATCAKDADFIRQETLQLLEEGKEVLLVGHSYAGVPMSAAAFGLSTKTRSRAGKLGGIVGLVYITAFIVKEGQVCLDGSGGQDPPSLRNNNPSAGLAVFEPASLFYSDVSADVAEKYLDELLPHSYIAFRSPSSAPAWVEEDFKDRFAYIRCTEDAAVPAFIQDSMMKESGVDWIVRDISSGHSPFVNKPKELADILLELKDRFVDVA